MTICREWSLVNHSPEQTIGIPLKCRCWTCDFCAPDRRKQLMAQSASGQPTRFITLTANPAYLDGPDERLKALSHAWRVIVQRLRRQNKHRDLAYMVIVEATKRGEPHLHILFRGPFIPQTVLSAMMSELMESPIVDIRRIRSQREVIRYVAKYITKQPHQFATSKRYWQSQNYQLQDEEQPYVTAEVTGTWHPDQRPLHLLYALMLSAGYTVPVHTDERLVGIPPPYPYKPE